jgi:dimethylaniline monooxygenase (N-oxide forming)
VECGAPIGMSVAVIGAGAAGIGTGKVLLRYGYDVVIYEKSPNVGGIWNTGYPLIPIQSFNFQYHFSDFPPPTDFSEHPTGEQVLNYLQSAAIYYGLNIKTNHTVIETKEVPTGWIVVVQHGDNEKNREEVLYNKVVVCTGLFTKGMFYPKFAGENDFKGKVHLGPFISNMDELANKTVCVVGYGKSAMDLVAMSAKLTKLTIHLFRTPRWALTERLSWTDITFPLFSRIGTLLVTCWDQPNRSIKFLHQFKTFIYFFWTLISWGLRMQIMKYVKNQTSRVEGTDKLVLDTLPDAPIFVDRPCVIPFNPKAYYDNILTGHVVPKKGEFQGFYSDGIVLQTGERVHCDVAVLSLGIQTPDFRYLPTKYRYLMEKEGGAQLYRHCYHPRIPRMAFIGLNQSFLFMPTVELSTLWMVAVWKGEMILPSIEVQSLSIDPFLVSKMF